MMCFPASRYKDSDTLTSGSGVNLRYFRPHPAKNSRLKITGYQVNRYDVKLSTKEGTINNAEKVFQLSRQILEKFPKKGFLDVIYYYIDYKVSDPFDRFRACKIGRLIKEADGQLSLLKIKDPDDYGQSLFDQGYARIDLIFHHGFKNKVMLKKKKINTDLIDLNKF